MTPRATSAASVFVFAFLVSAVAPLASAAEPSLEKRFDTTVRPFVETYCVSCHGKEKPEAELDLTPFSTMSSVIDGFAHWELVLERLEAEEMPPSKAKKHPTDAQRDAIVAWIHDLRKNEAVRNSGDP